MADKESLKDLGDTELFERLAEGKQELWKRRLDLATGQLDGTSEITNYKREIARIHTLMREREILAHEADRQEA